MSHLDAVPAWVALPAALLLVLAGVLCVVGALGLLRLSNFYQRIHGPAMLNTLGAGCVLIASMLVFGAIEGRPVIHELLITVFVVLTAPVTAILLMRAAIFRDRRAGRTDVPPPAPRPGAPLGRTGERDE